MGLSNTTVELLSTSPYWDDFSAGKRFHRILFKPKISVQTRELNQVQTILQNQVTQLTSGIFKEGASVVGGNSIFANNVIALQVVKDDNVDITNFFDEATGFGDTVRGNLSGAEARVIQVDRQSAETYSALILATMSSNSFTGDETISVIDPTTNSTIATMVVAPSPLHIKNAATFSVQAGTFFLNGHLVDVEQQTIILSGNTNLVSARVGFQVTEEFVTYREDTSLLDPAFGATNYAAPGADRLKLSGILVSKDIAGSTEIEQNSDENFIEIARVINGVPSVNNERLEPSFIEETLARRTYDESGDYVVVPFRLSTKDHNPPVSLPNATGTVTGNINSNTVISGGVSTLFQSEVSVGDILVVNGERREVSNVSSNTALRVNSAFSIDFTNTVFTIVSDDKMNIELEAGKAYVRGREFETLGTTIIEVDRPRTTANVNNGGIGTFFGPYVYVKKANSHFDINTFDQVDLHSVGFSGIAQAANTYSATKIGTARVRDFVYASGNGDANTVYKAYLVGAEYQTKTYTVTAQANSDSSLTTVLPVNSTGVVVLTHNASGTAATRSLLPTANDAYIGSTVSFYGTDGSILKYTVISSNATSSANLTTVNIVLSSNAFIEKINALANVVFSFTDKCIRGFVNANTKTKGATVDVLSKLGNLQTGNTVLFGTDSPSLIFKFRESWIKQNSISDQQFDTIKLFTAQTGSTFNATHTLYSLTCNSNMNFYPIANGVVHTNFVVANSDGGFASLTTASAAIGSHSADLYIANTSVGTGNIDVYAKMSVDAATPSTKTLYLANTNVSSVGISSGNLVSNTQNYMGHIAVNTINVASSNTITLGVPDVYALQKVYAVPDTSNTATWVDVTDRYTLNNGQTSWSYDWASLSLVPGYGHYASANQIVVMVDRFAHIYNDRFFTVDSYIGSGLPNEYVDIPLFTDLVTGKVLSLRDHVDFRAVRTANVAAANTAANSTYSPYLSGNAVFESALLPHPDSTFEADYEYYLPRIDKVVLTKSKELKVIQGQPEAKPKPPSDPENSMTLYVLNYPAYTANAELVRVTALDHRRYTMRDIGRLEKRIEHLEYYVQLSLLEERTLNQPELDGNDIERFKNGILIDPFASYAIANASDVDYRASIDRNNRELRPAFVSHGFHLSGFNANSSSNVVKRGSGLDDMVMLDYTTTPFITQPLASTKVNINPFNVTSWRGRVQLNPSTDQWMDTLSRGTVIVNLFDENSNWTGGNQYGFGTIWDDWQDNWSGATTTTNTTEFTSTQPHPADPDPLGRDEWFTTTTTETIVSQTNTPWRTGRQIVANMSIVKKDLGEKVIDISVAPFMRSANVVIVATALKPNSNLVAFFDEKDVTNYVERCNEIRVANSSVASLFTVGELVTSNVTGANTGTATVIGIVNDTLKVANTTGRFFEVGGNVNITGGTSGESAKVSEYVSFAGKLVGVTSTSNVTLDSGSFTVTNSYVGNVINFTSGTGAGQRSTIVSFDGATGYAGISPALATTPVIGTTYSIGSLQTDCLPSQVNSGIGFAAANSQSVIPGSFYGLFRLPGTIRTVDANNVETIVAPSLKFNTGKRLFRLSDNASIQYANTQAEAAYEASGLTKVVENTVVATREISFEQGPAITQTGNPVTSTTKSKTENTVWHGVYVDPLAQTFIVDPSRFANGVFITSVDLFFGRKDPSNIPVTVQIRPTVNGYPSSDRWLAEVSIPSSGNNQTINVIPDNITPNPSNTSHTTTFTFPHPVYLLPGQEYAIVVMSNSFEYELFVGQIGEQLIGDTRIISEQPYGGSLFKSQNAKTWTAEQNQDMMFVIHRAEFETSGTGIFNLGETINSSSVGADSNGSFDYDVLNIQTGHLDFSPTANSTVFTVQLTNTSNVQTSVATVKSEQNIELSERSRIVSSNATCVDFRASMGTTDPSVSPIYDLGRMSMIAVRNIIDNGGLYANGFTILSAGSGYTPSSTFVITANDTYGSGAVVTATVNSSGQVASIAVTSGSGYVETPTLTWSASATTNAVIVYRGETSKNCDIVGEQKARYITRKVTLADGFDASDLKVYISANRPPSTNIDVYYKILSTGDPQQFDNKLWTRMRVKSEQAAKYSATASEFVEFEYRTVSNNVSYTSNSTTFDRFHTFAIKLVMRSTDTLTVPRVRNLRAIALDE